MDVGFKKFHIFSAKKRPFGAIFGPHIFSGRRLDFFFLAFLEKKIHLFFRAAEGGPKKIAPFFFLFFFFGRRRRPKIFCPFLQYKRFLQGKKLVLSRKIILSRKTIFDPPPGGRGFSDLDTLGHYTCPCQWGHFCPFSVKSS